MELLKSDRTVNISEPILAEDSTYSELSLSLIAILEQLDEKATHHDYLVGLLLVLLHECGFHISASELDNKKGIQDNIEYQLRSFKNTRLVYMSSNWKSEAGYYILNLQYRKIPSIVQFIAIPIVDKLIINMYTSLNRNIYSMVIKTLYYVNPYTSSIHGRYRNLKEISHGFKDTIVQPIVSEFASSYCGINPCLLGLPIEIQVKIAAMLPSYAIESIWHRTPEFYSYYKKRSRLN